MKNHLMYKLNSLLITFPKSIPNDLKPSISTLTLTLTLFLIPTFSLAQDFPPESRELKGLVYQELFSNAREAIRNDSLPQAEKILNFLLENFPGDADGQLMRGRVLAWQGKYIDAEKDLLEVTRNTPEYTDAWYALTDLYFWTDRLDKAKKSCEMCLKQEPDTPGFYIKYARILIGLRLYPKARQALLKGLELGADPLDVNPFLDEINRIQNPLTWEGGVALDYQTFSTEKSDWFGMIQNVKRDFKNQTLMVEAGQYWRYDRTDQQLSGEIYADVWQNAFWNVRFSAAFQQVFLPDFDIYSELYQGFAGKWEGAVAYRMMNFPDDDIHIPALAVALYQGSYYFRYKFNYIIDNPNNKVFHYFSARYYYGSVDDYVEFSYGYGRDLDQISQEIPVDDSHVLTLKGQHLLHRQWIFQWMINHQYNPNEENQRGGRIGLFFRW
ncbi:MAG: YaiO family outer membrane beta-barrel protein [Candidatus Marinimicrobia bacterium]|nr:YaiO family outer membrane beta-barrel protein [Candidatus Neomarinimicrobiota bacterium]